MNKKVLMQVANQRAKYSSQSEALKDAHRNIKGSFVRAGKVQQTNLEKIRSSPILPGTAPDSEDIEIDFSDLM